MESDYLATWKDLIQKLDKQGDLLNEMGQDFDEIMELTKQRIAKK